MFYHCLSFTFDEGNDSLYGSGSWDHKWVTTQNSYKEIYGNGELWDGNFELAFPLEGVDGRNVDWSDLNITTDDIIGFNIDFYNMSSESLVSGEYLDDNKWMMILGLI